MKDTASMRVVALALLGAAMLAVALPAQAASRTCRQLQAELAGAPAGRGQPRLIAKYDDAIDRQHREIEKARGQARRAGCLFAIFGSDRAQCTALDAAIRRMSGNLDKLEKKRAKLGGSRDRQRILARLDANGCNDRPAAKPRTADARDDKVAPSGNDGAGRVRRVLNQQPGAPIRIPPPPQVRGEYRTLCVRTCDGYFFPMSNAATLGDFERDRKNCESSCPGTEMQVFYGRGLDDDSADMTSARTGRPYSELPTAYLYKRADISVPQCGCRAGGDFSIVGGSSASPQGGASTVSSSIVSFPAPEAPKRAAPQAETPVPEPEEAPLSEEQRNVRVVGPRFLPDPEAAIDLQAPARTAIP